MAIDRRDLLGALGGAGFVAAAARPGAAAPATAGQRWLGLDAARIGSDQAVAAAVAAAERLGAQALVVDGAAISAPALAALLKTAVAACAARDLPLHVHLGDLTPTPAAYPAQTDGPAFARTPHHRLTHPAAEALQVRLRELLATPGLAGVQFSLPTHAAQGHMDLIAGYLVAPVRLRGMAVTARLAPGAMLHPAWDLDAVFLAASTARGRDGAAAMTLLRQQMSSSRA